MLSLRIKDLKNRNNFYFLEKSKIINKFIFINLLSRGSTFFQRVMKFSIRHRKQSAKYSKVIITRRCITNNRGRGVLRPLGISRIYLRELMQFGFVPGYSKAVW